ncbi:hypothetical protein GUITHDRAFT_151445 [Guillardia theta CCMP2712]|uniref:MalT-like TPR region domain-containing protein n=2 Tax=Guillardia theta TaxID=55529 RepID=L1JNU9_GUITC|nr:hypothetical protein GUITHDRAFT_151445 [Guillardia theta CCMP2712]EKX49748.1 hypothetical protein GUITHDRAFT_151445 [Guillardia theta CCMP2712]|mmetsp:Transcript_44186/g.139400  ORF Transcript_44186/g.139400 Transcript_44186/m.139400 type:complete len:324 (+) Transcript_44186:232-1203(+)|eukprot:XP_005836728.1 hypothetical protein GUITHDRAFT_151445 [Guillardia theta CCMP2712]
MVTLGLPYALGVHASSLTILVFVMVTFGIGYWVLRFWIENYEDEFSHTKSYRRSSRSKNEVSDNTGASQHAESSKEVEGKVMDDVSKRGSFDGRRGSVYSSSIDPVTLLEIKSLKESIAHALATGDKELECMSSIMLADKCLSVLELERAVRASMQALEIARHCQDPFMEGRAHEILARVYLHQNQHDLASKYANNVLNISKMIQNKKLEGEACAILVQCLLHCTDSSKNQGSDRKTWRQSSSNVVGSSFRSRNSVGSSNVDRFQKSTLHGRLTRQAKAEEGITRALSNANEVEFVRKDSACSTNSDQNNPEMPNMFVRRSSF